MPEPTKSPKGDILLVDDLPENLRMLTYMLSARGYTTRSVTSGSQALISARSSPPDLIMMDISMPVMDGYETCTRLKEDQRTADIPVIFISAMINVDDKVRGFKVGGVDYVTKPFQIEEVVARLETHLSIRRLQQKLEAANAELKTRLEQLSQAQASEVDQRQLAQTLVETMSAINSSLNYNEVLERILTNIARVVPHDSSLIALLDEKGKAHIRGVIGFPDRDQVYLQPNQDLLIQNLPLWSQIEGRQPILIDDTSSQPEWGNIPEMAWIKSFIGAPIFSKETLLGVMILGSAKPGFFNQDHVKRLKTFADQAAVAIEKASLFEQVQVLAHTDGLTGIFNRRYLLQMIEQEYSRCQRYHHPLSLMMIDLDHFKHINDTYGHPLGDQVLVALTRCCKENLRSNDFLGRYGGEEFLVVLPETRREGAMDVAERLRQRIASIQIPSDKGPLSATVSIGAATFDPGKPLTLDQLIIAADDALYAAKAAGRNRVCS